MTSVQIVQLLSVGRK